MATIIDAAVPAVHDPAKPSDPVAPAGSPAPTPEPIYKQLGYESEEALLKGHKELRTKLSQPKPAAPATPAKPEEAAAAVAKAGLDLAQLGSEYIAGGNKLSDETYTKLEAQGISKEAVDGYIAGQQALAAQTATEFAAHVGGQEQLTKIHAWAKDALPEADKVAFDKVLDTGDKGAIKLALDGLKAKYEAANGIDPKRLEDLENGEPAEADVFTTWAQVQAVMNDPRYAADAAFRKKVEQKMARSPVGGAHTRK